MTQFLIGCVLLLAPSQLFAADSIPESEANLKQSIQDYYKALKASPDKSAATSSALQSKIIAPASNQLTRAIQKDAQKSLKGGTTQSADSTGASRVREKRIPAAEPAVEQAPIDSSTFEREIDFTKH